MQTIWKVGSALLIAVGSASPLDIQFEVTPQSLPISVHFMANIEYSLHLWTKALGLDRAYPGQQATIRLQMNKAEDKPSEAFMYATSFASTFPGSRILQPGTSARITFKDRPYVVNESKPHLNEDGAWLAAPATADYMNSLWNAVEGCDVHEQPCRLSNPGRSFDFLSHMVHEMGHVFGFVGGHLDFGRDGDPGSFQGLDSDGNPFEFEFQNQSHSATASMWIGFKAWERALPSRREIQALKVVLGYEGTHLVRLDTPGPGTGKWYVDSSFAVGSVEVNPWYASSGAGCSEAQLSLESPKGTRVELGPARPGWIKMGFVREDLSGAKGSRNPVGDLRAFQGEDSRGTWSLQWSGNVSGCEPPAVALRLTEASTRSASGKGFETGDNIHGVTWFQGAIRFPPRKATHARLTTIQGRLIEQGPVLNASLPLSTLLAPGLYRLSWENNSGVSENSLLFVPRRVAF